MTTREFIVQHLEPMLERWGRGSFRAGFLPINETADLIDHFYEFKQRCGHPMDIVIDGVPRCCNKPAGHDGMHQWSLSRETQR